MDGYPCDRAPISRHLRADYATNKRAEPIKIENFVIVTINSVIWLHILRVLLTKYGKIAQWWNNKKSIVTYAPQ